MIYKTYAHNFKKMQQNCTIEEIKSNCILDFYQKLEFQFITQRQQQHKDTIYRYSRFNNFAKHLTLNTDTIIFEQLIDIKTLKQCCVEFSKNLQMKCGIQNGTVNMFCKNHKIEKTISTNQFTDRKIQFCKDIENVFGKGEFPFMNVHIIKINNIEYFYYTISR